MPWIGTAARLAARGTKLSLAGLALLVSALACQQASEAGITPQSPGDDWITPPPVHAEWTSPSGEYIFAVSTTDNWDTLIATGELFRVTDAERVSLWSAQLRQRFGPRFVLVADAGTVVMLDEWLNVKTADAVIVVDLDNREVAHHSTDDVQAVLQVPMSRIVELSKHGPWMTAPPRLDAAGTTVLVEAAGKTLAIRVADGALSLVSGG